MPEVRIDPLSGQRVIVAAVDDSWPGGDPAVTSAAPLHPATDPFADGHEAQTPPELQALRPPGSPPDGPGWRVRVLPGRHPVLDRSAPEPEPSAQPDLFWAGPARGAEEVIVNSSRSVTCLAQLERDEAIAAVDVWRERMRAHADSACLHLVVDERTEAGAAPAHSHAVLYALDFVPAAIARERERFGAYATRTMGGDLLGDLVQQEVRRRERIVAIDAEAVLLSAYAARGPYQLMLVPRTPRMRFEDDGPTGAALLHDGLRRLGRLLGAAPPLNLWVRTAPQGAEHFCWRVDILPRLGSPTGLELGAGLSLNPVSPEAAAAQLRGA